MAESGDEVDKLLQEEIDEDYEPTEKELQDYADWLGIDLDRDPELIWIPRRGLKTPLPKPWKPCESGDGEIFYFNPETGASTWDHPCDEQLRKLYQQERKKKTGEGAGASEQKAKKEKKDSKKRKGNVPPIAPSKPSKSSALPPPPPPMAPGGSAPSAAPSALLGSSSLGISASSPVSLVGESSGGGQLAALLGPLPPLSLPSSGSLGVPPLESGGESTEASAGKMASKPTTAAGSSNDSLGNAPHLLASDQEDLMKIEDIEESIMAGVTEVNSWLFEDDVDIIPDVPDAQQGAGRIKDELKEGKVDLSLLSNGKDVVEPFDIGESSDESPTAISRRHDVKEQKLAPAMPTTEAAPYLKPLVTQVSSLPGGDGTGGTTSVPLVSTLKLAPLISLARPDDIPNRAHTIQLEGDRVDDPVQPEAPPVPTRDAGTAAQPAPNHVDSATATASLAPTRTSGTAAELLPRVVKEEDQQRETAMFREELAELREARSFSRVALNEAEAERDRLRAGASDLTNAMAEARRQRHLEEQRAREAYDQCEQLRAQLREFEADASRRKAHADDEVRQVRAEQQAHSAVASSEAKAVEERWRSELRSARAELGEERGRGEKAEAACQRQRMEADSLKAALERQHTDFKHRCQSDATRSSPPPPIMLDLDSPSPPTPQLASILVAELRPDDSKEQLSLWSPIEQQQKDPSSPATRSANRGTVAHRGKGVNGVSGVRPPRHSVGEGSLELSSLSAVLEQSQDDIDGSASIVEELQFVDRGRKRDYGLQNTPASWGSKKHLADASRGQLQCGTSSGNNFGGGERRHSGSGKDGGDRVAALLRQARSELVAKGGECDRLRDEAVSTSRAATEELHALRTRLTEEESAAAAAHKGSTRAMVAHDAPTPQPSPPPTLEAVALSKCLNTVKLSAALGAATKSASTTSQMRSDRIVEVADKKMDDQQNEVHEPRAEMSRACSPRPHGRIGGVVEECHQLELERLTREMLSFRDDASTYQRLLQDARAELYREQEAHAVTRAAARSSQREAMTLKGKLEGKDAEVERTVAEVQRCHADLADRDVEIHQLRLQLQAREAELGQLRSQTRTHCQQSDATLQRQRYELGEKQNALVERERLLDERERLTGEVEAQLNNQCRELRADRQRLELQGLRAAATELVGNFATTAGGMGAGPDDGGARTSRGSIGARRSNSARYSSSCGRRCSSADGPRRGRVQATASSRGLLHPLPSSDTSVLARLDAAPGCSSSPLSVSDEGENAQFSVRARDRNSSGPLDLRAIGDKPVKELAEILRTRRRELRSEHAELEDDRRRWKTELRQHQRQGVATGPSCDGSEGEAASNLPHALKEVRTQLDARAAELNKAIYDHRGLEQQLASRQLQKQQQGHSTGGRGTSGGVTASIPGPAAAGLVRTKVEGTKTSDRCRSCDCPLGSGREIGGHHAALSNSLRAPSGGA